MNENDISDIMSKITNMLNNSNNNVENTNNSTEFNNSNNTNNTNSSNDFNIDIETMLKIKKIMDKMNSTQNNPRTNLLLSLKPYLKSNKKDKIDQYIKLLNISSALEIFKEEDNNGGDNKC